MRLPVIFLPLLLAAQAPEPRTSLDGTVVISGTSQGIPNVVIALTRTGGPLPAQNSTITVRTDADGRFHFDKLQPGAYQFSAGKKGFFADSNGSIMLFRFIQWTTDPPTPMKIELIPQSIIVGRILDEYGEAAQGATITVILPRKVRGRTVLRQGSSATTNDRGEYRLIGLAGGAYYLLARYNEPSPTPGDPSESCVFLPTFYPGAADFTAAQAVQVQPGQELAGINLNLKQDRVFRVRGHVSGQDANLTGGIGVDLRSQDPTTANLQQRSYNSSVNKDGDFEIFGVPPGSYTLTARHFGGPDKQLTGTTNVTVGQGPVEGVQVTLGGLQEMTGKLFLEGPGIEKIDWTRFRVTIESVGPNFAYRQSTTDADGTFRQQYETPGIFHLNVSGPLPPNGYVASIRVGNEEYLGKPIDFSSGQPGPIRIIIRTDAALLRCTLEPFEKAKPDERVYVLLLPVEQHLRTQRYIRQAVLAGPGKFQIPQARPGDYLLVALEYSAGRGIASGDDIPEALEKAATRVHLDPDGKHDVQVRYRRPTPSPGN